MESMSVASGCGCKEVYRFLNITYPYILLLYLLFFATASLLFCSLKKCFFVVVYVLFVQFYNKELLLT